MEFGQLSLEELDSTNFSLPADSVFTKNTLSSSGGNGKPLIFLGCAKWGRKEWVGKLYPKGTKEADFLDHYVQHFNSIELNATHYKVYGPPVIGGWAAKAKDHEFRFCPKVPQAISHFSDLISPRTHELTDRFLKGAMAFGNHLGPIFLQVSDKFKPAKKDNLFTYLQSLPKELSFFVELRHPDWFADATERKELFENLKKFNVGAVITDTAGRRDCVHMELSVPKAFIRFVGNNLHKTDYKRVDLWVQRLKQWFNDGLKEVYFFMHQTDETYSPELSDYVGEQLNKHCNAGLKRPEFIDRK